MYNHDLELERNYHPENFDQQECDCEEGIVCEKCTDEDCQCQLHKSEVTD